MKFDGLPSPNICFLKIKSCVVWFSKGANMVTFAVKRA